MSSLFLSSSPNRSVLRVWSGVQTALRRGAPSPSNRPVGLLSPIHHPPYSPFSGGLSCREKHPHLDPQNAQANSAKTPSTDPLSWSLFHRDWRLGEVASAHIIRFFISSPPSFHEIVCDVCVVVRSVRPLASNTRDLSVSRLP